MKIQTSILLPVAAETRAYSTPSSWQTRPYGAWLAAKYPDDPVLADMVDNAAPARVAHDLAAQDESLRFCGNELQDMLFAPDSDAHCLHALMPLISDAYVQDSTFRRLLNHHIAMSTSASQRCKLMAGETYSVTEAQTEATGGKILTLALDGEGRPLPVGDITARRAMMHEILRAVTGLCDDPSAQNPRDAIVEYTNIVLAGMGEAALVPMRSPSPDFGLEERVARVFGIVDEDVCFAPAADFYTGQFSLPPELQAERGAKFPLRAWREPKLPVDAVYELNKDGYSTYKQMLENSDKRPGASLRQPRYELDVWRDRQEDFIRGESFTRNAKGLLERSDFPVLYRIDTRPPEVLLASNGFGPSRQVLGIEPMIEGDVLITSASLRASDFVLNHTSVPSAINSEKTYQYAIRADGVKAASWLENFKYLETPLEPPLAGSSFSLGLDEAHVAAGGITADRIYIIGSSDPDVERRLAHMHQAGVNDIFGVSIDEYRAHENAYPNLENLENLES